MDATYSNDFLSCRRHFPLHRDLVLGQEGGVGEIHMRLITSWRQLSAYLHICMCVCVCVCACAQFQIPLISFMPGRRKKDQSCAAQRCGGGTDTMRCAHAGNILKKKAEVFWCTFGAARHFCLCWAPTCVSLVRYI